MAPESERIEELLVLLLRYHGKAFRHRGAYSARVIEMVMSVDHRAKRLLRVERPRALNYGECSSVVLRRLYEQEVVGHLDDHTMVALAGKKPNARRRLSDSNGYRWSGSNDR